MPQKNHAISIAALLCATICLARAEESPSTDLAQLTDLSLEQLLDVKVVSASKYSQSASEAPSSISVLTAQDFRTYGWRTLADALRSATGFYVPTDRVYSYAGVRGFQNVGDYNSKVLLLIDGYRTNDNIYDQAEIGEEFAIDADLIERVEIVRGPSSSVYGGNALFAVINVITRSAESIDGAELAGGIGSYGLREGRVSVGKAFAGETKLLLSASKLTSDGPTLSFPGEASTGGRPVSDSDWEDNYKFFGKLENGGLRISVAHSDRQKGVPGGVILNAPADPGATIEDRHTFVDMGYSFDVGRTQWSARVSYSDYDYKATAQFSPPTTSIDAGHGSWWDAEIKGVSTFERHRAVYGVEYQYNQAQNQTNYDINPDATFLNDHRTSDRTGVFVQDDFELSQRTIFSAGIRYDAYSQGDSQVSPRLGLIQRLGEKTVAKVLYGTAFRPPNAYEEHYAFPNLQVASVGLLPEKIATYEFLVEMTPADNFQVKSSVYEYRMKNLVASGIDPATGLDQFQNLNQATARGAEIEAAYAFRGGTHVRGSISYSHARDGNGDRLENSPSVLAKLNASIPVGQDWRAGVESQFTSSRTTSIGTIPAYSVTNLTLSTARPLRGWEFFASIYNLFDKSYFNAALLDPPRDRLEMDGRTFRLKAVLHF
jgi:iron complex outermembrane receptor protein